MSEKKQHEIKRMAPLVQNLSAQHSCDLVADIGCGTGYLEHTLSSAFDMKVIGFELRESNCSSHRYVSESKLDNRRNIYIQQLMVDSTEQCTELLRRAFSSCSQSSECSAVNEERHQSLDDDGCQQIVSDPQVCLVGLHCCGDLTPSTIKQFCALDECKVLICMGCCYHRLSPATESGYFLNFPMANKFSDKYGMLTKQYGCTLNTLALRLACQETKSRWVSNCFYFEAIAVRESSDLPESTSLY